MSDSLKHSRIAAEMAEILYDFLPGSGRPEWKGHVNFRTVSEKVGVGKYWRGGSKEPAIAFLLENTLENKRSAFEPLMTEIIKEGIRYRKKNNNPVTREDIEKLNALILQVDFKFPTLWDEDFLASLDSGLHERARKKVEQVRSQEKIKVEEDSTRRVKIDELKAEYYHLFSLSDRQKAGFALEKLLNELFELSSLKPRGSFRLEGEQIDGSFELDNEIYLLEAKWHKEPLSKGYLGQFRDTIKSKSTITRGVFVSIHGVSEEALSALVKGQTTNFFIVDGYDLSVVLEQQIALTELFRWKIRHWAEEGRVFVSAKEF